MSHKNDVKNARNIFGKLGKKSPSKEDKLAMLRQHTNWNEQKIQNVMKTITTEAMNENA